ncbi:MAG: DUF499 domain-containing protein [Planctomycetes bacterium]|nr:DUF499 domain-containing protein [Planctomycetota bacterium]
MAKSNRQRIGEGLEIVLNAMIPFVEDTLIDAYGDDWLKRVNADLKSPMKKKGQLGAQWDNTNLINALLNHWAAFGTKLSKSHRSYIHELRDIRNGWAHDETFSYDQAYRALDTMKRVVETASAGESAKELEKLADEVMRVRFTEQRRGITRKIKALDISPQKGLKPWRDIIAPHQDVAEGNYRQAEFAADLAQVHRGDASPEYGNPKEFFSRTFITDGLRTLLIGSLRRINGKGGDPVVKLQTNFGGGKTHSMLALYHLFGPTETTELPDVEAVLKKADVANAPECARAVIVGTDFSPGHTHKKPDGVEVHTMWGELAWQLGNSRGSGKKGYKLLEKLDKNGTSPGSGDLKKLFDEYAPCLILIDEWVAFLRNINDDSPAGTLDSNLTFVQALTEGAKSAKQTQLVASLPQSLIEIGGDKGKEVLNKLEQVFARVETPWRPATAREGFEIVRRRLFKDIEVENLPSRDAVVKAFSELYQKEKTQFPFECSEDSYRKRMEAAYPFHPELFERLYGEWSTLDRFQRTRGVLRLMAAVIHCLWDAGDKELMIMPCSIPLDADKVKQELSSYLEETWEAVFDSDIDGEGSAARRVDNEVERLGRSSACRRVARAIFLGTAPAEKAGSLGIGLDQIRLACVQPGEIPDIFADGVRRLYDHAARYLYNDGERYWFGTQPTVARIADERATQQKPDDVVHEIRERLRKACKTRGTFAAVHACPADSSEVPDEAPVRLIVLGADAAHTKGKEDSPAMRQAKEYFENRGGSPRLHRNSVVFLAADQKSIEPLLDATRRYKAWDSIVRDREKLNLSAHLLRQAETKQGEFDGTCELRIKEAWVWAIVPHQPDPTGPVRLEERRVKGDSLIARVAQDLAKSDLIYEQLGPKRLKMELDNFNLWGGRGAVGIKALWEEYLTRYVYLPRLTDEQVLLDSIRAGLQGNGMMCEFFAYAEGYDEVKQRFEGLRTKPGHVGNHPDALIVKAEVALAQQAKEKEAEKPKEGTGGPQPDDGPDKGPGGGEPPSPPKPVLPRHFTAAKTLNSFKVGLEAAKIADEILTHLTALSGADVTVRLTIDGEFPDGVREDIQRIIKENARTLKFEEVEFDE